jgi:transcriptional regulator with XRE-family HTH domain
MLYLARILAGASQSELARAAGIKEETLSRYERGLGPPRLPAATRLAIELDLPLDLIGRDVELIPLEHPGRISATAGQVVAEVRIATSTRAGMRITEETAPATNAASETHPTHHDPAKSRHASLSGR